MGSVWKAQHVELSTPAAVKLIDPLMADSEEALVRFKREAQAAATLRSPHVVQILDYGVDEGTPYIAMELMEGESLAQRLKRQRRLTPDSTATMLTHVARAVGKAHEIGVVHRDLKPDNIFLVPYEDDEMAKVLDFGIAKRTTGGIGSLGGPETRTGSLLGTPHYMSPEQASGRKEVDHRTDVWAIAVIAFECLTGKRPFVDETLGGLVLAICTEEPPVPSSLAPVPPGFDEWFARGTAKDAAHRFQSAKEQAAELCEVCGVGARRSSLPSTSDPSLPGEAVPGVAAAYPSAAPAVTPRTAPKAGSTGSSTLESTGTQAPPSSVTVSSYVNKSKTGLLIGGAALAALVVVGAVLVFTGRHTEAPSSAAASAELSEPIPSSALSAVEEPEPVAAVPEPSASVADESAAATETAETDEVTAPSITPVTKATTPPTPKRRTQPAPAKPAAAPTPVETPTPKPPRDTRSRLESDLGL